MESIAKLPAPTQDQWEWQYEGACREADPDLFFHPEGERGAADGLRAAVEEGVRGVERAEKG